VAGMGSYLVAPSDSVGWDDLPAPAAGEGEASAGVAVGYGLDGVS